MEKKSVILGFILAIVLFGLIALASAEDWNLGNPVTVQNQNVTGRQNLTFLPENAVVIIGAGGNVTSDANLTYYLANQTLVVKLIKTQNISDSDNSLYYIDTANTGASGVFAGRINFTGNNGDAPHNKITLINTHSPVSANVGATNDIDTYFTHTIGGDTLKLATRIRSLKEDSWSAIDGWTTLDSGLSFWTMNTASDSTGVAKEQMRIDEFGNILINTTASPTDVGGNGVNGGVFIGQMGAVPTTLGVNTAGIYVIDVAGTAELFTIDEGATSTQQTSHPSDFLNTLPNDENHTFPWVYTASNPYLGKKVTVDEEAAFRAIEVLTGKQFVWTENISKISWADTENWRESEENNKSRNTAVEAWLRNASAIPVTKNDAFETITETITETTKNITGFDTEYTYDTDGNVASNIVPIYETKTKIKTKKVKKYDVFFDKKVGNFYRKPTKAEAEAAVGESYPHYTKQTPPKWMQDRGAE